MGWTIKQTTEMTGIPADTLRYYDKEGIVCPKRHENGYRHYDEEDITSLKNLIVMKYAHFSLSEIKSMEELFTRDPGANCNDISREIMGSKIIELRKAISNYQKIITLMEEMLSMIGSFDSYVANEEQIDDFLAQIFEDIRSDKLFPYDSLPTSDRKEAK